MIYILSQLVCYWLGIHTIQVGFFFLFSFFLSLFFSFFSLVAKHDPTPGLRLLKLYSMSRDNAVQHA